MKRSFFGVLIALLTGSETLYAKGQFAASDFYNHGDKVYFHYDLYEILGWNGYDTVDLINVATDEIATAETMFLYVVNYPEQGIFSVGKTIYFHQKLGQIIAVNPQSNWKLISHVDDNEIESVPTSMLFAIDYPEEGNFDVGDSVHFLRRPTKILAINPKTRERLISFLDADETETVNVSLLRK